MKFWVFRNRRNLLPFFVRNFKFFTKLNLLTGSSPSPCGRVKFSARKFWEGAKVKSSNRIFGIFFILTFYIILKPIKSQGGNRARSFYELVENLRGVKPNALIFKLTLN